MAMTEEEIRMEQARQEAMEKEYTKSAGGNYFSYVDTAKLEREGITQWKPSVGPSAIRIVYPPDRAGYFGLEIFKHSNVGVNRKTFICKRRMFDEPCPVCEFQDQLRKADSSDPRVKELNPSRRYLFFVVDISSPEEEKKGRRWFDCPVTLFNEIKSRSKNRRRRGDEESDTPFLKYVNVSHPTGGRDIEFEQTKEQGKYDYTGCDLREGPDVPKSWYTDLPEFKEILKLSGEEEMLDAVSDQFEQVTDELKESAPRERSDLGSREIARTSSKRDDAELEPEIEEPEPEIGQETASREPAKSEDIHRELEQEVRGKETRGNGSADGEQDMQSRVQARLKKAREQRRSGQGG